MHDARGRAVAGADAGSDARRRLRANRVAGAGGAGERAGASGWSLRCPWYERFVRRAMDARGLRLDGAVPRRRARAGRAVGGARRRSGSSRASRAARRERGAGAGAGAPAASRLVSHSECAPHRGCAAMSRASANAFRPPRPGAHRETDPSCVRHDITTGPAGVAASPGGARSCSRPRCPISRGARRRRPRKPHGLPPRRPSFSAISIDRCSARARAPRRRGHSRARHGRACRARSVRPIRSSSSGS